MTVSREYSFNILRRVSSYVFLKSKSLVILFAKPENSDFLVDAPGFSMLSLSEKSESSEGFLWSLLSNCECFYVVIFLRVPKRDLGLAFELRLPILSELVRFSTTFYGKE